jgi:hypothetical protein
MDSHSGYPRPFARSMFPRMAPLGSCIWRVSFLMSPNNPLATMLSARERSIAARMLGTERAYNKAESESKWYWKIFSVEWHITCLVFSRVNSGNLSNKQTKKEHGICHRYKNHSKVLWWLSIFWSEEEDKPPATCSPTESCGTAPTDQWSHQKGATRLNNFWINPTGQQ